MSRYFVPLCLLSSLLLLGLAFGLVISKEPVLALKKEHKKEQPQELHYSFFGEKGFFGQVFEAVQDQEAAPEKPPAIIVNHHLLAPDLIARSFLAARNSRPKTVVIISPDHFDAGEHPASISARDWSTEFGILEADQKVVERLLLSGAVGLDEIPFGTEHGVSNIVSFAKKAFPEARIVPIIIQDRLGSQGARDLAQALDVALPEKSLVVGSFDFSHELPQAVAEFHDEHSLSVLRGMNYERVKNMDIDSRYGLEVVLRYARARGSKSFRVLDHSSAAERVGDPETAENTSYIVGYFSALPGKAEPEATIMAGGDLFLGRYVKAAIDKEERFFPFEKALRLFLGTDESIVNVEGPFTGFEPQPLDPNNTTFTFDPALAGMLPWVGITMTTLANNHTLDYGHEGLAQTKEHLESAGIGFFGDPQNKPGSFLVKEINGLKIGFVGYSQFQKPLIDPVLAEVEEVSKLADQTIVYAHWGHEYHEEPSAAQREMAHSFVDAGADIVIGSHPHVIQPAEVYQGKMILYSLGNFLFDQIQPGTTEGLVVGMHLSPTQNSFNFFPTKIESGQVRLMAKKEGAKMLEDFFDGQITLLK